MKKWECTVCGYIHTGEEPPEQCPLCSAPREMFQEVIEEQDTSPETPASPEQQETSPPSPLATLIMKLHLHPIAVHTPNGVLPIALVFMLIAVFFGIELLEPVAFFNMLFVLITLPVVFFTGFIEWQNRYSGALTSLFKVKIIASLVVAVLLTILVVWRLAVPTILSEPTPLRWVFVGLSLVTVGAVGLAGHMGGKLVFGARDNA